MTNRQILSTPMGQTVPSLRMPIIWTVIFGPFAGFLIKGYFDGGPWQALAFAFLLLSPVFYWVLGRFFTRLVVYEKGFVIKHIFGEKVVVFDANTEFYIEHIQESFYSIGIGQHVKITVVNNGKKHKIPSNFRGLMEVESFFCDFQQRYILPHTLKALDKGKTVDFGAVSLSRTGFRIKKNQYTWGEIEKFEISNGCLYVYLAGVKSSFFGGKAHHYTLIKEIANFEIFTKVLAALQK